MPVFFALGLLLATVPEKPSVVVVGLHAVDMAEKKVAAFAELFADELASTTPGLKVTSSEALASIVGLERQRQLVGCSSDSACLSEIVGALGPATIVSGSVVRLGGKISVSVRALAAADGRLVYGQQQLVGSEDAALSWLKDQAPRMGQRVLAEFTAAAPASRVNGFGIASGVVTGIGLVSAIAFWVLVSTEHTAFVNSSSLIDAQPHQQAGQTYLAVAWASSAVTVAAGIATALFFLLPSAAPSVSLFVGPGGGVLSLGGSF